MAIGCAECEHFIWRTNVVSAGCRNISLKRYVVGVSGLISMAVLFFLSLFINSRIWAKPYRYSFGGRLVDGLDCALRLGISS